jgi:hypothetical protein
MSFIQKAKINFEKKKKTMQKLWCRVCLEVAFYDQTGYRGFCLSVIFKGRM